MALQRSRTQTVAVHQIVDEVDKDIAKFNASFDTLTVQLWPLESQIAAQIYGDRLSKMLLLHTSKPTALLPEGAGVCVDVALSALPDYRVVSSKNYLRHTAAHLEWQPEGDRGAYAV